MSIVVRFGFRVTQAALRKSFLKLKPLFLKLLVVGFTISSSSCSDAGFIPPPSQNLGSNLNTLAAEQYPQLSYDGHYLVFASDRQAQRHIWLYDLQEHRLLPLPGLNQPGTVQDQPDISADGRYIVYVSEQSGKPDIFVYDRQTLKAENITKDWLGEVRHPTISGNGRFVVFETNRSGQWDLTIYDRGVGTQPSLPQILPTNPPSK
jgi:Tol biopolymer transport system component